MCVRCVVGHASGSVETLGPRSSNPHAQPLAAEAHPAAPWHTVPTKRGSNERTPSSVGGLLRRFAGPLVLGAAALLAVAAVAGAAIPDSDDGEIHGCYQKNQGSFA